MKNQRTNVATSVSLWDSLVSVVTTTNNRIFIGWFGVAMFPLLFHLPDGRSETTVGLYPK